MKDDTKQLTASCGNLNCFSTQDNSRYDRLDAQTQKLILPLQYKNCFHLRMCDRLVNTAGACQKIFIYKGDLYN